MSDEDKTPHNDSSPDLSGDSATDGIVEDLQARFEVLDAAGTVAADNFWNYIARYRLNRQAKRKAYLTWRGSAQSHEQRLLKLFFGVLFELLTIILGIIFLWFNALFFFLKHESVDLSLLKPNAAMWFTERFDGQSADLDTLRVDWIKQRQALAIVADGVSINDADGLEILDIPHLASELDLTGLAFGRFIVTRAEIEGGAVTAIRLEDGTIRAGLGAPDKVGRFGPFLTQGEAVFEEATPDIVVNPLSEGAEAHWRSLSSLRITNGTAYLVDEQDKLSWILDELDMHYEADEVNIQVNAQTTIGSGASTTPLILNFLSNTDLTDFELDLKAEAFKPSDLAPEEGSLAIIRRLDAPIKLTANIKANATQGLTRTDINFEAAEGRIKLGENWTPFEAAKFDGAYDVAAQSLNLTNLSLHSDRLKFSGLAEFSNFGTPNEGFGKNPIGMKLDFIPFYLDLGDDFESPLAPNSVNVTGRYSINEKQFDFSRLVASFDDYEARFSGVFDWQERQSNQSLLKRLALEGQVTGDMGVDTVLSYWPVDFALGGRDYVRNRIEYADIKNVALQTDITDESIARGNLLDDELSLSFDLANTTARYISTMTPISQSFGRGVLRGNSFEIWLDSGKVGAALDVTNANVSLPQLVPKGGDFYVTLDGQGGLPDMLRLIDEPPLNLASKGNLIPEEFTGDGTISLSLTRPLLRNVPEGSLQYAVTGKLSGVSAPMRIGNQGITDGEIDLFVDNSQFTLSGPVNIGPWRAQFEMRDVFDGGLTPTLHTLDGSLSRDMLDRVGIGLREYFDGEILLKVNAFGDNHAITGANIEADLVNADISLADIWEKPRGEAGRLTAQLNQGATGTRNIEALNISAQGLSVAGDVSLAEDFRLKSMLLDTLKIDNFINASVTASAPVEGQLSIGVKGDYINISPWFKSMIMPSGERGEGLPVKLEGQIERLVLLEDYEVNNAQISYHGDTAGIVSTGLTGEFEGGAATIRIVSNEADEGRRLSVALPDAGAALKSLYGLGNVSGGQFSMQATLPPRGMPGGLQGTATVTNFKLIEAPVFARILSLASLQGLGEILSGDGMNFNQLTLPFTLEQGALSFDEARASGSAIGLTGTGYVDFERKEADLAGVIVPSYTINSMLGGIPLIGDIVVGKEGEGIFALNYSVKGPFEQTQVGVNPLSALTPGFLRRIFDPSTQEPLRKPAPVEP